MTFLGISARAAVVAWVCACASAAFGQSAVFTFQGGFDAVVDCDQPLQLRGFAIRATASGSLNRDGTGSAELNMNTLFSSPIRFDGRLGRSTPAPGGSARMQIVGKNRLRLIWELPNNLVITDIRVAGGSCTASLSTQLKGGHRQYSLYNGNAFFYCGKPRVVSTSCTIR